MRLSEQQQTEIVSAVRQAFGSDSRVWLFGSRVDDTARGGDIDLYVESAISDAEQFVEARLGMLARLHRQLGERKIDVAVRRAQSTADVPIWRLARTTGVELT